MPRFKQIRRNTPISVRLIALVVLMLLFISLLGAYSIRGINQVSRSGQEVNEKYLSRINQLSYITENLYSVVVEGKNHILALDANGQIQAKERLRQKINNIDNSITRYGNALNNRDEIAQFQSFVSKYEDYKKVNAEIIKLSETGKQNLALELSNTTELQAFRDLQLILQAMMSRNLNLANTNTEKANATTARTHRNILIIIFTIIGLSAILSYTIIRDISQAIQELKHNLTQLGKGKIPQKQLQESDDEVGQMAAISNVLTENYARMGNFASHLGQGNYNTPYEKLDPDDVLGESLENLRVNLKKSKEENEKRRQEDELRHWANRGLAKFADILREHAGNIHELAGSIIKNTIQYIEAAQGGIFLYNDDDRENPFLELLATYAYNKRKFLTKHIAPGEGLVGTCAIEKETVYLEDIPPDYIEIRSGMGATPPKSLLIVPLKLQDEIFGVVEIASMRSMKKHELEFIEKLADNIASTLSAARLNERTHKLLDESKQKSDELSSQEEEMRQNLEEMRATQEQSERREIELRGILSAIDHVYMKSEYDLNGNLITANSNYLEMVGYHFDDLKEKNVRIFVPEERKAKFETIWENLLQGIPYSGIFDQTNRKGETRWLMVSYTPIKDNDGDLFKMLFLGTDITQVKLEQAQIEEELIEAKKQKANMHSRIRKIKFEYQNERDEIRERLNNMQETTKSYEYELSEIHKRWLGHLTKAQKIYTEYKACTQQLDEKENALMELHQQMERMKNKIQYQKPISQREIDALDSEQEKRYGNWLNDTED